MRKLIFAVLFVAVFICGTNFVYAKDYYACEIENYQAYVDGDGVYEYKNDVGSRAFFAPVKMVQNGELITVDNFYFEYDPKCHAYVFSRDSGQNHSLLLYYPYATKIFFVTTKTVLGLDVRA